MRYDTHLAVPVVQTVRGLLSIPENRIQEDLCLQSDLGVQADRHHRTALERLCRPAINSVRRNETTKRIEVLV